MKSFTQQNQVVVNRLDYASSKGTYIAITTTYGFLIPLSEMEAAANDMQWGKAYELQVELNTNIEESDQVVINSLTYIVRGVATYSRGNSTAGYIRCTLILPETS